MDTTKTQEVRAMDRKEMVKVLGEHFGVKPRYLGVPSFAYQIETATGIYIIDRVGIITNAEGNEVTFEALMNGIREEEATETEATTGLTISVPMDGHTGMSLRNFVNMIYSKQTLIKKALEIEEDIVSEELAQALNETKIGTKNEFREIVDKDCKNIKFGENTITFKFGRIEIAPEKITAYTQIFELISQQAKTLRYASAKAKDTDNEKFTFRVWLNRLGMIGNEYKQTRKVLLKNLTGNSAFRYGKPEKETTAGE